MKEKEKDFLEEPKELHGLVIIQTHYHKQVVIITRDRSTKRNDQWIWVPHKEILSVGAHFSQSRPLEQMNQWECREITCSSSDSY